MSKRLPTPKGSCATAAAAAPACRSHPTHTREIHPLSEAMLCSDRYNLHQLHPAVTQTAGLPAEQRAPRGGNRTAWGVEPAYRRLGILPTAHCSRLHMPPPQPAPCRSACGLHPAANRAVQFDRGGARRACCRCPLPKKLPRGAQSNQPLGAAPKSAATPCTIRLEAAMRRS